MMASVNYVDLKDVARTLARNESILSLFPESVAEKLPLGRKGLAIGDVAGRDSFAASLAAFEQGLIEEMLPIAVHTEVEYGDFSIAYRNVQWLQEQVRERFDRTVYDMVFVGDTDFWRLLNARFASEIVRRYEFYTPCIGCHFHFHASRTIVAKALGIDAIVSGERTSHDGRLKANQLPESIAAYGALLASHGVRHLQTVKNVADGDEIERILGKGTTWGEGLNQMRCVFNRNTKAVNGEQLIDRTKIGRFLEDFLTPLVRFYVDSRLAGNSSNLESETEAFLKERWGA